MKPFQDYFSAEMIIIQLVNRRMKEAEARNRAEHFARWLGSSPRRAELPRADLLSVYQLLPPRSAWSRFRPRLRSPHQCADPNRVALKQATMSLLGRTPDAPWAVRLRQFIIDVQARVLGSDPFVFAPPDIKWQLKDKRKQDHKYRPLARFNLMDNVISCLFAKYLRELLDPAFESSSYAFRARSPDGVTPTHHDAFDAIHRIRCENLAIDLHVAECDIQGFYDCVEHEMALTSLLQVAHRLQAQYPDRRLDLRAIHIFRAYLACYSFPQNVLAEAQPRLREAEQDPEAYFAWPAKELSILYGRDPFTLRLGLPQGSAISCVAANLILDLADKLMAATHQRSGPALYYFRFCDDMIMLSPSRSKCQQGYKTYLETLRELKLPYHRPERIIFYGKQVWDLKSKAPYCWSGRKWFNCVPWVQFVGYQVRYDSLVRPRKSALEKHILKLRATIDQVKYRLLAKSTVRDADGRLAIRSSKKEVIYAVQAKITSMGVGRIQKGSRIAGPKPMCWANGFRALHGKPIIPASLKRLDRQRERQLGRLFRANIAYGPGRKRLRRSRHNRPAYYGKPWSYYAQFENRRGRYLVKHPYRAHTWFERSIREPLYKETLACWKRWQPLYEKWRRRISLVMARLKA